jgi:hypothetical protein
MYPIPFLLEAVMMYPIPFLLEAVMMYPIPFLLEAVILNGVKDPCISFLFFLQGTPTLILL